MEEELASKAYIGVSNKYSMIYGGNNDIRLLDPYTDLAAMQTCAPVGDAGDLDSVDRDEAAAKECNDVCDYLWNAIGVRLTNVRVNHCKQVYYPCNIILISAVVCCACCE